METLNPSDQFRRLAFTLIELLSVIAIIGVLAGLVLPAVQAVREATRKTQCQNNLKQIGLGLHSYESAFRRLPAGVIRPAGLLNNGRDEPRSNWAIAILPYLEQGNLYGTFRPLVSLNDSVHAELRSALLSVYRCPSDANSQLDFEPLANIRYARGNYGANYGTDSWGANFWNDAKTRGVMGQNSAMTFAQITDGLSNTVAIGELLAHPNRQDNRGVWSFHAPGSALIGLDCDVKCQGINGDPRREWIPYCAALDTRFPCTFQNNHQSNAGPRSKHASGAHFAWCDGSVSFLAEETETEVLLAAFGSGNGE